MVNIYKDVDRCQAIILFVSSLNGDQSVVAMLSNDDDESDDVCA